MQKYKKKKTIKVRHENEVKVYVRDGWAVRFIEEKEGFKYYEAVWYSRIKYENLVDTLVAEKYSIADQIAILRQKDTKPDEFEQFNNYVEDCKSNARAFIEERNTFDKIDN